jgi:hypothetical protein
MPPDIPTKKETDDKPKPATTDDSGGSSHGTGTGTATSARPSRADLADKIIKEGGGGGTGGEHAPLSDAILAVPKGNFHWNLNRMTLDANLAEGKATVTNMSYKVSDGNGGTREISGPSSFNAKGQQFIIDSDSHKRYLITPPADEKGPATLTPLGRRGTGEPLTVVEAKPIDGFTRRSTTGDVTQPVTQPATPAVKPADVAVVNKPGNDGGTPPRLDTRTVVTADAHTGVVAPAVAALTPVMKPDGSGLSPQLVRLANHDDTWFRQHNLPEQTIQQLGTIRDTLAKGGQVPPEFASAVQKSVSEFRAEQWRNNNDGFKPGNPDNPQFKAQPPLSPDQLDQFRKQFQQNPQAAYEALRQIQQAQQGDRGQGPGQFDKGKLQDWQQAQRLDQRLDQQQFQTTRLTPDQIAQLLQQQAGGRTPLDKPNQPGDVALDRIRALAADLDKGGIKFSLDPQKSVLDPNLRDLLSDKNNRTTLMDLLKELQVGKLPNDAAVQNNKQLQDIMKALGPEALADLRKVLMHQDGTIPGGKPGDGKFDITTLSPKTREIIELIAAQSMQKTLPADQMRLNAGTLVSERLLDILRQNDKTQIPAPPKVPDAEATRANMLELGKAMRELNSQNPDGKALTLKEILGRSLELGPEKGGLVVRTNGPEDMTVRALLDRLQNKQQDAKPELSVRAELISAKIDAKIDVKLDQKPERPDLVKADIKLDTGKEINTNLQIGKPQERILDPDQLAQAQKDMQAKYPGLTDKERDEKLEEERNKAKEIKHKKDEELPVDQAALMAALAAKKRKELDDKDKQEKAQEKDKKEPERRQKYIVRPGDSLEIIATRMLRDKRLAGLIYEINSDTIPIVMLDGKKVPQVREKMVIWLPTPTEAKDYRTRLMSSAAATKTEYESAEDELAARFGKNWDARPNGPSPGTAGGGAALEDMEDAARVAYAARRKHIESLLGPLAPKSDGVQPKHVVRLGESLKSVAIKHPALQDVTLWKLLAELNGLPTQTDERGTPTAKLIRGQSIILPSQAEIEAFRQREAGTGSREKISGALELPTRTCAGCKRTTFASASLCPGCGRQFEDRSATTGSADTKPNVTIKSPPTRTAAALPKAAVEPTTRIISAEDAISPPQPQPTSTKQFSESARLMIVGTMTELSSGYKMHLEILANGEWKPVVVYEIFAGVCLRHEVPANGQRKTIRIDLPPQAAIELATNDLESNWKSYEMSYRKNASRV